MEEELPDVYGQLVHACAVLEEHYRGMQDGDFRLVHGSLWILGTCDGTRAARAAVKIVVDMANERLITREEAVRRARPEQVDEYLLPQFAFSAKAHAQEQGALLGRGMDAFRATVTAMADLA
jgi:pyruvate,orthophosphate dikinase